MKRTLNLRKNLLLVALVGICATGIVNAQALKVNNTNNIQIGPLDSRGSSGLHSLTFGQGKVSTQNYGQWAIEARNGDIATGGLRFYKPSNESPYSGSRLYLQNDGKVGIGTTSPNAKLDVYGDIALNGTVIHTSDRRYKTDIKPFTDNSINDLFKLNGVTYKTNHIAKSEDEILRGIDSTEEYKQQLVSAVREQEKREAESDTRTKFGFVAQELREVYPNLVFEDEEGYLSVNYIGMIPVLVEAIKEQQKQIDELKVGKSFEKGAAVITSEAKLYQNNPNPFSSNTDIKYYLPNEVKDASIRIYNLVGEEIAKFDLVDRGYANLTINGNVLKAGMYNYALLVDGQLIDTKQMVLTK